jgi:hypothetical protein|tara:strand:- start:813 stop:1019 length:207 start_codon:yes stop_codon:yes gene_type:complete
MKKNKKNKKIIENVVPVLDISKNIDVESNDLIESCKHEWECLRDRCHNRGKGKYMAYKCKLCNKFQRR